MRWHQRHTHTSIAAAAAHRTHPDRFQHKFEHTYTAPPSPPKEHVLHQSVSVIRAHRRRRRRDARCVVVARRCRRRCTHAFYATPNTTPLDALCRCRKTTPCRCRRCRRRSRKPRQTYRKRVRRWFACFGGPRCLVPGVVSMSIEMIETTIWDMTRTLETPSHTHKHVHTQPKRYEMGRRFLAGKVGGQRCAQAMSGAHPPPTVCKSIRLSYTYAAWRTREMPLRR